MTSTTRQHLLSVLSPTVPTCSTTANKTLFLSEDAEITGFILTSSDGTKHFVDSGAVITLDATKSFNLFHPNAHTN